MGCTNQKIGLKILLLLKNRTKVCIMVRIMTTTMTIKIDKKLKEQAQSTAKRLGIPLSTIINAYLREMSATGRVAFTASEEMTPSTEKIVEEFQKEMADGDVSGPFDNVDEFLASLKA
jgi:addiction module RelB/DinJ family antitoxin